MNFLGIEALRGFAAVAIMLDHVHAHRFAHSWAGPLLAELSLGVPVFFVISGFLLFRQHAVRQQDGRPPVDSANFLARRGARIVPAYLLMLLGAALIVPAPDWTDLGGAQYLFFLQEFSQHAHDQSLLAGIGSTWSVCIEVWFYFALAAALAAMAVRRPRLNTQLTALVVLAVALVVAVALTTPPTVPWDWARSGLAFTCGCILAILHMRGLRVHARVAAAVLVAMVVVGGLVPAGIGTALAGTTLALCAVLLGLQAAPRRLFLNPVALWLGAISYGIYLWNQPILFGLRGGSRPDGWGAGTYATTLAAIALTILAAAASWYLVERRILERVRTASLRWRKQPEPELPG